MQFSYNELFCPSCGSPLPTNGAACTQRKCRPAALRRIRLVSLEKDTDPEMADLTKKAGRQGSSPRFPQVVIGSIPVKDEVVSEATKESERLLSKKVAVCIAQGYTLIHKEPGRALLRRSRSASLASRQGEYEMLNLVIDDTGNVREAVLEV